MNDGREGSDVCPTHSFCGVLRVVGLKQPLNSSTANIILNLPHIHITGVLRVQLVYYLSLDNTSSSSTAATTSVASCGFNRPYTNES